MKSREGLREFGKIVPGRMEPRHAGVVAGGVGSLGSHCFCSRLSFLFPPHNPPASEHQHQGTNQGSDSKPGT